MWLVPLGDLTEDQLTAVQASTDRHRIIVGGPGSGKTLVLVHRAHQLILGGVPRSRVRVLVFTNVLKDYLHEGLVDLGLIGTGLGEADGDPLVQTFDAWVRGLYGQLVKGRLPFKQGNNLDHELIRARVHAALVEARSANPSGERLLDVALVDEGQDLSPVALEILAMACGHVTLAMDSRQQIYDQPTDLDAACAALGVRRAAASLLTAYRCTPLIVDLAAWVLPDPEAASAFRKSTLLPIEAVETPVAFEAQDDEAELDELARQLMNRAMNGEACAVLVPSNRLLGSTVEGLRARGLQVATDAELDFDDLRPAVLTYHKAKGLTVDSVFMPRLIPGSFPSFISDEVRGRLLFVGITRATRWAWLGLRPGERLAELADVDRLVAQGSLKLKAAGQLAPSGPAAPAQPATVISEPKRKTNLADLL